MKQFPKYTIEEKLAYHRKMISDMQASIEWRARRIASLEEARTKRAVREYQEQKKIEQQLDSWEDSLDDRAASAARVGYR